MLCEVCHLGAPPSVSAGWSTGTHRNEWTVGGGDSTTSLGCCRMPCRVDSGESSEELSRGIMFVFQKDISKAERMA